MYLKFPRKGNFDSFLLHIINIFLLFNVFSPGFLTEYQSHLEKWMSQNGQSGSHQSLICKGFSHCRTSWNLLVPLIMCGLVNKNIDTWPAFESFNYDSIKKNTLNDINTISSANFGNSYEFLPFNSTIIKIIRFIRLHVTRDFKFKLVVIRIVKNNDVTWISKTIYIHTCFTKQYAI